MNNFEKTEASFNYRNPLNKDEPKPAFGLEEEDASMPNHSSHMKSIQNARLREFSIETSGFELLNHKSAVKDFFATVKPEYVILAAGKVGGVHANNTYQKM